MMNIVLKSDNRGSRYEVSFQFHPKLVANIKNIKDARYDGARKLWVIPSEQQLELEKFCRFARHFTEVVIGEAAAPRKVSFEPIQMEKLTVPHTLKINPYPYQEEGIAQGVKLKRFINGDDPGLGKTLQSIATINIANAFPCLIICPATIKINWEREWHKFTDKKAMVLTDSVKDTWPFFWQSGMNQVFIVNYESLKKYFVQKINKPKGWRIADVVFKENVKLFKSVIFDEGHKCKEFTTQQAKLTYGISQDKEYVIDLTGTPIVKTPKDIAPQLAIINKLDVFGGYQNFLRRYCSGPNRASNLEELNYLLRKHCFFKRKKEEVLHDLPDKVRQVMTCEINNRTEYAAAEKNLIQYLIKYKYADDEKIAAAVRGEVMVRIGILRNISARGKLRDVIEFTKDFIEGGEKIILFVHLREVADTLLAAFPKSVAIRGGMTGEEKQHSIDTFRSDPDVKVIVCSIMAAGVGVNGLQEVCSNVGFVEFPWNYSDCIQCEDRAHRIGQKDSVTCYYFLGRNTIDEKVYQIIQEKKNIANAATGSEDNVSTSVVNMVADIFNMKREKVYASECE